VTIYKVGQVLGLENCRYLNDEFLSEREARERWIKIRKKSVKNVHARHRFDAIQDVFQDRKGIKDTSQ
jgi:hypothetical protein